MDIELTTESLQPAAINAAVVVIPMQAVVFDSKTDLVLQRLINSKQLPGHVRTIEEAFTIAKMGKELGFPIMQSFHFIIPIQGKLTLSAKAIGALMRKNKVTMQTLEDALYIYRDGAALEYPRTVVDAVADKPIDRRTTILFTRDGIEEKVSFTWIDATNQELTVKSNWRRMAREMLFARCLSKGANRIGQDFLMGLYSADEIFDSVETRHLEAIRDEDGTIISINTPHQIVA